MVGYINHKGEYYEGDRQYQMIAGELVWDSESAKPDLPAQQQALEVFESFPPELQIKYASEFLLCKHYGDKGDIGRVQEIIEMVQIAVEEESLKEQLLSPFLAQKGKTETDVILEAPAEKEVSDATESKP